MKQDQYYHQFMYGKRFEPGGHPERVLEALVLEWLDLPRWDKAAKEEGIPDKDVAVRARFISRPQANGREWAEMYRHTMRPALLELYRDGLISFDRLGRTGIWMSNIRPTKAGIQYIRLLMKAPR